MGVAFLVWLGDKKATHVAFSEKNHIFRTRNQNKFGREKNRALVQKGNVCCLFSVITRQRDNVGCFFREESYFSSEKSKTTRTSTKSVSFQKGKWPSSPSQRMSYAFLLHRLPSPHLECILSPSDPPPRRCVATYSKTTTRGREGRLGRGGYGSKFSKCL